MNYNIINAIYEYNQDQVRTQTMYEIDFISGLDKIDNTLRKMQVYGQNFTLPDRTVNFEDLQYRAYKIPVPTTIDMGQEHSITVYADVRGDLRRALLDWQAACINPDITGGSYFESNRRPTRIGPGGNKNPQIIVKLLAPDYQTVVERTLMYGARVTKVGGLELSNLSGGISTFSVDFKSVYWEQDSGKNAAGTRGGAIIGSNNDEQNRNTNLGNGYTDALWGGRVTEDPVDAPNII